ncbi:PREDICTED: S-antigen protein-like [Priapulus caudatus]|uniref:S-antigen protein-like n=1 Tax=Priapulus caudatus TaxID=37621 RepID=A0ABM1E712_PRICU|nr:PREDICTED: S-antigen protein-like [Priapulus caudatus]
MQGRSVALRWLCLLLAAHTCVCQKAGRQYGDKLQSLLTGDNTATLISTFSDVLSPGNSPRNAPASGALRGLLKTDGSNERGKGVAQTTALLNGFTKFVLPLVQSGADSQGGSMLGPFGNARDRLQRRLTGGLSGYGSQRATLEEEDDYSHANAEKLTLGRRRKGRKKSDDISLYDVVHIIRQLDDQTGYGSGEVVKHLQVSKQDADHWINTKGRVRSDGKWYERSNQHPQRRRRNRNYGNRHYNSGRTYKPLHARFSTKETDEGSDIINYDYEDDNRREENLDDERESIFRGSYVGGDSNLLTGRFGLGNVRGRGDSIGEPGNQLPRRPRRVRPHPRGAGVNSDFSQPRELAGNDQFIRHLRRERLGGSPLHQGRSLDRPHSFPGPSRPGGRSIYPGLSGPGGPPTYPGSSGPRGSPTFHGPSELRGPSAYPGPSGPGGPSTYAGPSGPGGPSTYPGPSGPGGPSAYPRPSGPGGPSAYPGPSGPGGPSTYAGPSGPGGPSTYPRPSGPGGPSAYPGPSGPGGPSAYPGPSGIGGPSAYHGPSELRGPSTYPGPSGIGGPSTYPGESAGPSDSYPNYSRVPYQRERLPYRNA